MLMNSFSLTFDFDQDRQVASIALDPGLERREKLEILTVWRNMHFEILAVFWRCLVEGCAVFEMGRKFLGMWWAESELISVRCRDGLCCRVKL